MAKRIALIFVLVLLVFLCGCTANKSNPNPQNQTKLPADPAETTDNVNDAAGRAKLPEVESNRYASTPFGDADVQAFGIMLDQNYGEVIKVLGKPLKLRKEASEAVGYQLMAAYNFGELTFDALDNMEENSTLSFIIINQPKYAGPRGIEVGDSLEAVLANFPQEKHPVREGLKQLYSLHDGEQMGEIAYDENNQVQNVRYVNGPGGFGTYSLDFEIKNSLVTEIRISVMNV